ncbi:MAG: hypothetical protein M1476_01635 [Candidatus Thermoplasmatota archaeon]|nr:hypothetical protein [Candidatus Thermoplasmatota archaeon]
MWRKRNLLITSVVIVAVISASIGFFELGLNQGEAIGYQTGFSNGSNTILIQSLTQVELQANQTVTIVTQPFSANNINVYYSFVIADPYSQNATVEMSISASGHPLFDTGYHSTDSGNASLSTANLNVLTITFRANQNNGGPIILEFNSPLRISFN